MITVKKNVSMLYMTNDRRKKVLHYDKRHQGVLIVVSPSIPLCCFAFSSLVVLVSVRGCSKRFVYECPRHNGIGELLEILGSIVNGFATPLKKEHGKPAREKLLTVHDAICLSFLNPNTHNKTLFRNCFVREVASKSLKKREKKSWRK